MQATIKKNWSTLIKHMHSTSDVEMESWLKFLNKENEILNITLGLVSK